MKYWIKNQLKVPKLGFGTFKLEGEMATRAVKQALEVGLRHIDTAQIYQNEAAVGLAMKKSPVPREDIFLTTKIWRDSLNEKEVYKTFQESLERLKTDYVDLLLVHWPNLKIPLEETLSAFHTLKEKNKTRHIGVSNFTCDLLKQAQKICPSLITNQVEYHPFLCQQKLLTLIDHQSIFLTAYSPLMRGKVFKIQPLVDMAEKYNKSPGQLVLKWLVDQKNVVTLFKASNKKHIKENFNIFDFELKDEDKKHLFDLGQNNYRVINPLFAPQWDD